jgi:mannose-6-phosphate isomerase-like protein (cupin superfamily)
MPGPNVEPFEKSEWRTLPAEGARNVEVRVLWHGDDFLLAQLRFGENANVHEHAGPNDAYVSCLEGRGLTKVGDEVEPIEEGQRVFWPKGVVHGLWTEGSTMTTLMFELQSSPSK